MQAGVFIVWSIFQIRSMYNPTDQEQKAHCPQEEGLSDEALERSVPL